METQQGKMLDKEYALVLKLHRDDLVQAGLPERLKAKVDDSTLEEIADKLSDAILDICYGDCLGTIISDMKMEIPEGNPLNDEGEA